jgi:hypothetical protein
MNDGETENETKSWKIRGLKEVLDINVNFFWRFNNVSRVHWGTSKTFKLWNNKSETEM